MVQRVSANAMTAPPLAEAARALMRAILDGDIVTPAHPTFGALRAALEARDILSMSDEAVIAQAVADGIDPATEAARGRELFKAAVEQTKPLNWKQAQERWIKETRSPLAPSVAGGAAPVRQDWCEEHHRGSLADTDGICPECEARKVERIAGGAGPLSEADARRLAEIRDTHRVITKRGEYYRFSQDDIELLLRLLDSAHVCIAELETERKSQYGQLAHALDTVSQQGRRIAELEASWADARDEHDAYMKTCDGVAKERDGLYARIAELERENAEVIEANSRWSVKCSAVFAERDALQAKLAESNLELKRWSIG